MTELLVLGVLSAAIVLVTTRGLISRDSDRSAVALTFPHGVTDHQVIAAVRTLTGLLPPWWRRLGGSPHVTLEAIGSAAGISHRLTMPTRSREFVLGSFRAAIPGLRVSATKVSQPPFAIARELRVRGIGELRKHVAAETNAAVLAAVQPLAEDETVVYQLAVAPTGRGPAALIADFINRWRGLEQPARARKPEEPQFGIAVRVGVAAGPRQTSPLIARALGALHPLGTTDARLIRRWLSSPLVARRIAQAAGPDAAASALGGDEIAALAGFPIGGPLLPGLTLAQSRELPAVPRLPLRGLILGDAVTAGVPRPVAIDPGEARRGLHICAPTGAGKSTLLLNLATQAMELGQGLVVIDSKGDLIADLADRTPRSRLDDVIVFDPADRQRPLGFNLIGGGGESDLIVDHVTSQFRARYGATGLGPRSEDVLRASLLTLARHGGMTLCEVEPLLTNAAFRQRLVGALDEPVLESFWAWYGSLSDAARAEVIAPLANKLRSYTLRPRLRAVIGQQGGLDLTSVVADGKVLLVSLAKGLVGEDAAALLGAAITSRLWTTIQARAGVPEAKRRPVTVICDEFQDFAALPLSFGDAIAQSRGYGVGWVLAHQHLGQLDVATRQAVLANCRSRVVMQTTATDSSIFAREFAPHLDAADLQGLGPFEAYAAVSVGSAVMPPASITTRPAPTSQGTAPAARRQSRERYGMEARAVDAAIRARVQSARTPAPIGGKRRQP